jgi:hypothetical protein
MGFLPERLQAPERITSAQFAQEALNESATLTVTRQKLPCKQFLTTSWCFILLIQQLLSFSLFELRQLRPPVTGVQDAPVRRQRMGLFEAIDAARERPRA